VATLVAEAAFSVSATSCGPILAAWSSCRQCGMIAARIVATTVWPRFRPPAIPGCWPGHSPVCGRRTAITEGYSCSNYRAAIGGPVITGRRPPAAGGLVFVRHSGQHKMLSARRTKYGRRLIPPPNSGEAATRLLAAKRRPNAACAAHAALVRCRRQRAAEYYSALGRIILAET